MDLVMLCIAAVLLLLIYTWFPRSGKCIPPFPARPLPIVGNLFILKQDTQTLFRTWRQKYGDIFSLYLGGTHVVVLNGYDLIKEALITKADIFSDRPKYFYDVATGIPEKGIVAASGKSWKEHRSVVLSILRSFGMGKNVLAEKIMDERNSVIEYLASLKEKPTNIQLMVYVSVSNIICSILIGQRFEYDDKEFDTIMQAMRGISSGEIVTIVNFLPWLQYFPGDFFNAKKIALNSRKLMSILTMFKDKKKRDVEDIMEMDNFIDAYMIEKNKRDKAGLSTFLDEDSLKKIMLELFEAGSETTSTTIYWCVLYMIVHPDVQEKVYQEIKDKVGTDRAPTMQDKNQLTYLSAVINETQRLASIAPLSVTHICSKEFTLRGYTLPKGTSIITNLDSVLHDKTTWGDDATSFRPERFIDDNGKLKIPEQFIPFSIGPRVCLGEAIARMELFLFLSSMFQRFQFLPSDDKNLPSTDADNGFVRSPKSYETIIIERH
uniref:Cytochrome P450 n=1 Tax=Arion vulgaris TaxID=1028688 RepID=A0A0B7BT25_9EUPU